MSTASQIQVHDLLSDQVQSLNSAMLVAQTAAERGPVHKLRTTTRRLEAQLVLLQQLPGLPEHARESAEVTRELRRVRRAAASVRDLDVQAEMIAEDMPGDAAVRAGTRGAQIRKEAQKLLKKIEKRRKRESHDMVDTLRAESEDMAAALRALQQAIQPKQEDGTPASSRGFTAANLSERIQSWFSVRSAGVLHANRHPDRAHALQKLQNLDEETLHSLRKAAKQCRYMAESLPEKHPLAKKLADRFEYLQEAGGRWHDWLLLEEIAARIHGKHALLTERYRNHRDAALAEFHLQLALEFTTGKHGLRTPQHPYRD